MKRDEIAFENLPQQRLFAVEEVVKTAGVHLCVGQQISHRSAGKTPFPE